MGLNRTAKGIVLVPSLLLGAAFLATGAWVDGPAAANRGLALGLGAVLIGAGLFTQLLPEAVPPAPEPLEKGPKALKTEGNTGEKPDQNRQK